MTGNPGLLDDVATCNEASVNPEPIRDSLRDILREAASSWHGPLPSTESELRSIVFRILDDGLRQAGEYCDVDAAAVHERVSEFLFRLKDTVHTQLHVYALLICLGKIADPEEVIARRLGVTKQAVSKCKIMVQEFYGLRCRVGRSDKARRKFAAIVLNREPQQRNWEGMKFFSGG
jgi:hypothetical protein